VLDVYSGCFALVASIMHLYRAVFFTSQPLLSYVTVAIAVISFGLPVKGSSREWQSNKTRRTTPDQTVRERPQRQYSKVGSGWD
jgi:hypothetical protein